MAIVDPHNLFVLEMDVSAKIVGAFFLQNGYPVAFEARHQTGLNKTIMHTKESFMTSYTPYVSDDINSAQLETFFNHESIRWFSNHIDLKGRNVR